MMRLSRLKRLYLKTYYRQHSDAKLAKALGVEKTVVRTVRGKFGWDRSKDDEAFYRDNPEAELPPYTGQIPRPLNSVVFNRGDFLTAAFTFLASFVVYWLTLGRTVTGEDSGELITAAYTMGIAHPPGYPLWCILGKLFTFIPAGTIPFRVALVSAVFASLTVFLACLIGIKLTRNRIAAAAGALAFAFSFRFWMQSVIVEMNTLNSFFVALWLFLLFQWYDTRRNAFLYAFAISYGFGLTNHHTTAFLGPPLLALVFFVDREPWRRWKVYLTCLGISLLPLLIFIYLPIRAATNPPANWGNPSTLENFWDVVTRKQYQFGFTKDPRTSARLFSDVWAFLGLFVRQFTPWLAIVPVFGAAALWKKSRFHFVYLVGLFFYISVGFILILNFDIDKQSLWVNDKFWIPAYLIAGVFVGAAVDWVGGLRWRRFPFRPVGLALASVCVVLPLAVNYRTNDMSHYTFARDNALNILKTLEPNAIYVPTADHHTFPILYLQAVEGMRPDITIGNKYGYPEQSLYVDMPEDQGKAFKKIPSEAEEKVIEEWIISHTDRPVYFTKKRELHGLPDRTCATEGLLYKVVKKGEPLSEHDWWSEYEWSSLDPKDTRGDLTAEFVLADYHFARGRHYVAKKESAKAKEEFALSLALSGENKESLNNLGSVCAENGMLDEALDYYSRTLKLDPKYDMALRNLGKVYFQKEKYAESIMMWDRILKKNPGDYEANWLGAQCLEKLGKVDDALAKLQVLAQVAPKDDKVFRELGMILLNQKGDRLGASRMFSRSLELNPNQQELMMLAQQQQPKAGASQDPMAGLTPPGVQLPEIPGIGDINTGVSGFPATPRLGGRPQPPLPQAPLPGVRRSE